MTAKVILNPYANRWKALKQREMVEDLLKKAGLSYELVTTEAPEHGTLLATEAALAGFSPVIAAGGDGTISEIVNGLVAAALQSGSPRPTPLGIIPLGSANDLVINLGLPTDLPSAIQVLTTGHTRQVDLGEVRAKSPDGKIERQRYFDNNSAIGLEPYITLIQQRIPLLHGARRYLVATLIGVLQKPQWTMHLEWDSGEYHGLSILVTVGNNPLTGGLFYMTPHANPYDGKLSFVYGSMSTRRQALRLLPRTMKPGPGSYVEHPDIHEGEATWLRIRTDQPTPVHADGEILFDQSQEIEYRILPLYLPVLAP